MVGGDAFPTVFGRIQQIATLDEERGVFQRPVVCTLRFSSP